MNKIYAYIIMATEQLIPDSPPPVPTRPSQKLVPSSRDKKLSEKKLDHNDYLKKEINKLCVELNKPSATVLQTYGGNLTKIYTSLLGNIEKKKKIVR